MGTYMALKAGRIWHDLASVGRKLRRAEDLANSLGCDRAGFEPHRGRDFAIDFARIQTPGSKRSSMNESHGTAQIRRGITVGDSGNPRRAEIFALPALGHP